MNWFWMNLFWFDSFCLAFLWLNETLIFCGCRNRDSPRLENLLDVETETHWDWEISWMSKPRLIQTEKFLGCQDRNSSRLRNILDVKTETHQDWEILGMLSPKLIETGKFNGCRDRDQSRLGKRCRYRDSIKTLADLWYNYAYYDTTIIQYWNL